MAGFTSANFFNPYYVPSTTAVFSYAQPIVIQDVVRVETREVLVEGGDPTARTAAPPEPDRQALSAFDEGLEAFRVGQYVQAMSKFDTALAKLPGDPVIHEMRALTYFALGKFRESAAVLNALLATSAGMDWTTLSGLYGELEAYTRQVRALEEFVDSHPDDAAAQFVLAYHYLVMGHREDAVVMLESVVKLQPKDVTARQILTALGGGTAAAVEAVPPPPAGEAVAAAKPATETEEDAGPQTDLVGRWRATGPDVVIELTVTEDFGFTWNAKPKDQDAVELSGELFTDDGLLVLETEDQGAMFGQVTSEGENRFRFAPPGVSSAEQALTFERQPQE